MRPFKFKEMDRFSIIPKSNDDIGKSGVYRIWFGDKFYIGSTCNSYFRMKSHSTAISKAMAKQFYMPDTSVKNIVVYLKANPCITEGIFEMIQICEGIQNLVDAEYIWLMTYKGRIDCLNMSFHSTRSHKGVKFYPTCLGEL